MRTWHSAKQGRTEGHRRDDGEDDDAGDGDGDEGTLSLLSTTSANTAMFSARKLKDDGDDGEDDDDRDGVGDDDGVVDVDEDDDNAGGADADEDDDEADNDDELLLDVLSSSPQPTRSEKEDKCEIEDREEGIRIESWRTRSPTATDTSPASINGAWIVRSDSKKPNVKSASACA